MSRRKCGFNAQLKAEYPFLEKRPNLTDSDLTCTICNANFSIANSGRSQIVTHLKSVKHYQAIGGGTDAAPSPTSTFNFNNSATVNKVTKFSANFCFICFKTDLSGELKAGQVKNDEKQTKKSIKFLLNYLLQTPTKKTNDAVLNSLLKMNGIDQSECLEALLQLCEKCEEVSGKILEIHLELEELQRRMISEIGSARETVVKSAGWLGGTSGDDDGSSSSSSSSSLAFENFSRRFFNGEGPERRRRMIFDILKAFQKAVSEAAKDNVHVPLADLERSSLLGNTPLDSSTPIKTKNFMPSSVNVKTEREYLKEAEEPEDDDNYMDDDNLEPDPLDWAAPVPETVIQEVKTEPDVEAASVSERRGKSRKLSTKRRKTHKILDLEPEPDSSNKLKCTLCGKQYASRSALHFHMVMSHDKGGIFCTICNKKCASGFMVKKHMRTHSESFRRKKATKWPGAPQLEKVHRKYSCQSCNFISDRICKFEQHLRCHELTAEKKNFQCAQCDQGFSTRQYYILHEARHKGAYPLRCDVCLKLVDGFELASHLGRHPEVGDGNRLFQCSYCSHCSSSRRKHLDHLGKNHNSVWGELRCDICDGGPFTTKKGFLEHLDQVHPGAVERIMCEFEGCGKTYLSQEGLNAHKAYHTEQFSCKECSKSFSSRSHLRAHQRLHLEEKPIRCEHCPQTFRSPPLLQAHMSREHGLASKLKCELCEKEYTSRSALRFHMVMSHEKGGKFCPVCNKKCVNAFRLKVHMSIHSDERNHACDVCGKTFRTYDLCYSHKRTHNKERRFHCSYCPKTFTTKKYLTEHLGFHENADSFICDICGKADFAGPSSFHTHRKSCSRKADRKKKIKAEPGSSNSNYDNEPAVCDVCGKVFRNLLRCKVHQRLHRERTVGEPGSSNNRNPKNSEPVVCDVCGKVFRNLRRCQIHRRLHRDKTFQCPYCPKVFPVNKYLTLHLRTHTGETPFHCECGKSFKHGSAFSVHKRKCQQRCSLTSY